MICRLIRHATIVLDYKGQKLLVDPVLSPKGALNAISASPRQRRNPLVSLPMTEEEMTALLQSLDGVLVTHTHTDHFDAAAAQLLPRNIPLFCQPEDAEKFRAFGFTEVTAIASEVTWNSITITRRGGRHGSGYIAEKMAPVSGYVLSSSGEPTVYIAGDTIWCQEVADTLAASQPDIVITNAGAARFLVGGRITMSACDILKIAKSLPDAQLIAVHMEAYNHCLLTRKELSSFADRRGLSDRMWIPGDGEKRAFGMPAFKSCQ